VWAGALQPTSVVVKARLRQASSGAVRLAVTEVAAAGAAPEAETPEAASLETARRIDAASVPGDPTLRTFDVGGLAPGGRYSYAVEVDGELARDRIGRFATPATGPFSFTIALGGCANTGSSHPVFDEIRAERPLFFLHLGDFHYENVSSHDLDRYRRAYDRVLASPGQAALYRSTPLEYVWDDHDFTGNDSDRTTRGRAAARRVYREVVPHYPLAAGDGDAPIHHSFVIGRVLFVVTDSRSERTPHRRADGPHKTMLGASQKQWLFERLSEAHRHGLVVWVNSLPWIARASATADHWGGYAAERREIATWITGRGIANLVMVAGDGHMLAIDDGSNNRFGGGDAPGFPVLQAAALDRNGSLKGGPYSEGAFPGGGQYALMTVEDHGGELIRVRWSGRRHRQGEIVGLSIEVPVPSTARSVP
jgi:phosphodiesterase/alkaline phosphatase D-like protein